jgi:hypothetical protein
MSIGLGVTKTHVATGALNGTGIKLTAPIVKPENVYRFGFIVQGSTASGTAVTLDLVHRVVAGDSGSDVVLETLSPTATVAQGEGVYMDVTERVEANPGSELLINATTGGATTNVHFFIEAVEYPFARTSSDPDEDRLDNMTEEV